MPSQGRQIDPSGAEAVSFHAIENIRVAMAFPAQEWDHSAHKPFARFREGGAYANESFEFSGHAA